MGRRRPRRPGTQEPQRQLAAAEHLGVRNTTLRRWLDGAASPQLSLLPRIAEITGLTHAIQLVGGAPPPAMRAEAQRHPGDQRAALGGGNDRRGRRARGELAFSDAGARLAGSCQRGGGGPAGHAAPRLPGPPDRCT